MNVSVFLASLKGVCMERSAWEFSYSGSCNMFDVHNVLGQSSLRVLIVADAGGCIPTNLPIPLASSRLLCHDRP